MLKIVTYQASQASQFNLKTESNYEDEVLLNSQRHKNIKKLFKLFPPQSKEYLTAFNEISIDDTGLSFENYFISEIMKIFIYLAFLGLFFCLIFLILWAIKHFFNDPLLDQKKINYNDTIVAAQKIFYQTRNSSLDLWENSDEYKTIETQNSFSAWEKFLISIDLQWWIFCLILGAVFLSSILALLIFWYISSCIKTCKNHFIKKLKEISYFENCDLTDPKYNDLIDLFSILYGYFKKYNNSSELIHIMPGIFLFKFNFELTYNKNNAFWNFLELEFPELYTLFKDMFNLNDNFEYTAEETINGKNLMAISTVLDYFVRNKDFHQISFSTWMIIKLIFWIIIFFVPVAVATVFFLSLCFNSYSNPINIIILVLILILGFAYSFIYNFDYYSSIIKNNKDILRAILKKSGCKDLIQDDLDIFIKLLCNSICVAFKDGSYLYGSIDTEYYLGLNELHELNKKNQAEIKSYLLDNHLSFNSIY